nr:hypothetical protein 9 [Balneolaceae bacterium]
MPNRMQQFTIPLTIEGSKTSARVRYDLDTNTYCVLDGQIDITHLITGLQWRQIEKVAHEHAATTPADTAAA